MAATLVVSACTTTPKYLPTETADTEIAALMEEHKSASVGIGIIRDRQLVWTGYFGQQSPGVAVGPQSMFNTASVNKAITAETALRLASKGLIDLDEPVSAYYVHPDIADDPRHELLTPRILLTHQAGFLNWPFLYDDGKLAFIDEPGNGAYNYSGVGIRIFAKFLEAKLGSSFPEIVKEEVFEPLGMTNATISHDTASTNANIVAPVDENGNFTSEFDFVPNYWSAADDLFVSVEDYAAFLIATMNNHAVSADLAAERVQLQTDISNNEIWRCGADSVDPCPDPYGHGVGWFVFGTENGMILHHGGNDVSEGAIGYFNPETGDGGIVFVNSSQGVQLWPKIVDVVDPEQEFQDVFHDLINKYFSEAPET